MQVWEPYGKSNTMLDFRSARIRAIDGGKKS
jgi:hypothetical protein